MEYGQYGRQYGHAGLTNMKCQNQYRHGTQVFVNQLKLDPLFMCPSTVYSLTKTLDIMAKN